MNFKIIHSSEIDRDKWNIYSNLNNLDVYNTYDYLQASTGSNWYGIIWGDYVKVLPFYQKKKWKIIPYICMPAFCQKFETSHLNAQEFNEVISYFKSKNLIVDFRVTEAFGYKGFQLKQNFILDKTELNYEQLSSKFNSLVRKNKMKADQYIDLEQDASESLVRDFLSQNELFQKLNSDSPWILDFPYGRNIAARYKGTGEVVAVLFYISWNQKAYLITPYSSMKGKNTQAMTGIILELIRNTEIKIIDFEGSNIDSIAQFYKQFGAEKQEYFSLNWNKLKF